MFPAKFDSRFHGDAGGDRGRQNVDRDIPAADGRIFPNWEARQLLPLCHFPQACGRLLSVKETSDPVAIKINSGLGADSHKI